MPITLNHSNISVQYSSDKSYIIETVKSDLYLRNETIDTIVRNNIQTAPVTPTTYVDNDNVYAVESYTYSGSADTADFTRVFSKSTTCDILVVGGGGGGDSQAGGGGGGGAVLHATNITIPANTYIIKVGKGGARNIKGGNSEAFGATCLGGGSTLFVAWATQNNGTSGGSGSGGSPGGDAVPTGLGGTPGISTKGSLLNTGTLYNGNNGGNALVQSAGGAPAAGGGGGGAGTAGFNSSQTPYTTRSSWIAGGRPSKGGDGVAINITGVTYYWGAGGGGGSIYTHAGDGGLGGGGGGRGNGSVAPQSLAGTGGINNGNEGNAAPNTGSGGGGGDFALNNGGSGGSGIVIIRYLLGNILLNPILDPIGAQWTYNSSNANVYHLGNVGIGTTNPNYNLDVSGTIFTSTGGYTQTGLTTWTVMSDRRIKENIVKASYEKCLENVKNIDLYSFNFKDNCVNTNDRHQLGFIAQEVQQVYPKAVEVGKMMVNTNETIDNVLTLNTTQIKYTLYGAVKELINKVEMLETKINM